LAARSLSGDADEGTSIRVELLKDIKAAFGDQDCPVHRDHESKLSSTKQLPASSQMPFSTLLISQRRMMQLLANKILIPEFQLPPTTSQSSSGVRAGSDFGYVEMKLHGLAVASR
jgi:hypothetical protein